MVQYIQLPRGTTDFENARVAPPGVVTIDEEGKNVRLHDGMTPGGHTINPTDQFPNLGLRLFSGSQNWSGGTALSGLSGMVTALGSGTFTFEDFANIDIGVPVILRSVASEVIINSYQPSQRFIVNGNVTSFTMLPRSVYVFGKIGSDFMLLVSALVNE